MAVISPVRDLLDQWLLLPLFADVGMIILVLRSARNRAGFALAALLCILALLNIAALWPKSPIAAQLEVASASILPAAVALFVLSYACGSRLAGPRRWRAAAIVAPAAIFAAAALITGTPAGSPAVLGFSLLFFGASVAGLVLSGAFRSLSGEEPNLFAVALALLIGTGPVYGLALPLFGIELPLFSYSSAAAGAMFVQATLKYKAFAMTPAAERPPSGEAPPPRGLYIARNGERRRARDIFSGAVCAGVPGAIFTRTHPAALRRQTGIKQAPVIWLANSPYERCLPPSNVGVLTHTIRDMGEESPGCIVLIEDLDYLVANAGLFSTLGVLEDVLRLAARDSMTVIMSSDLLTDAERRELRDIGVLLLPRDGGVRAPA